MIQIELRDGEVALMRDMLCARLTCLYRNADPAWQKKLNVPPKEAEEVVAICREEIKVCNELLEKLKTAEQQPQPCPIGRL